MTHDESRLTQNNDGPTKFAKFTKLLQQNPCIETQATKATSTMPDIDWFQQHTPLLTAYHILLTRGFLVEIVDDHLSLSDNALIDKRASRFPSDERFLAQILKKEQLGTIDSQRVIHLSRSFTQRDINHLFPLIHFKAETSFYSNHCTWRWAKRPLGRKIQTYCLDPRIALLVKSLSAIGVATSMSCHDKQGGAFIQLCPHFDANWLQIILHHLTLSEQLRGSWLIKKTGWLPSPLYPHRTWRNVTENFSSLRIEQPDWKEIFSIAALLYENRFALRAHKSRLVDILETADLQEFPTLNHHLQCTDTRLPPSQKKDTHHWIHSFPRLLHMPTFIDSNESPTL